jgi:folate-binding protein YgfZ
LVTGRDRASFLHNMCTNDVRGLTPGNGCEAFFTDVKGKVVAHAAVLAADDVIQLVSVPESAERLIAHLDRYIIREDVQLVDASAERAWTLLVGLQADDAVTRLAVTSIPESPAPWSHGSVVLRGDPDIECQQVRCDLPWCGGRLLGCASSRAVAVYGEAGRAGAIELSDDVWHAIRIESAWPLWGVDFDAAHLPQEINRDAAAIHFRKGCYLGQETVARIDALGHVNKKLVQVRFAGDRVPQAGDELLQGDQCVGRVTSACWSPRFNAPLALAMVKREANEPGAPLQWGGVPGAVVSPDDDPAAA